MANILLNKPATASNSFAPFLPSRAVDGVTTDPKSRWACSLLPAWLKVDLQTNYWINQWNASFMGSVGWAANYNLSDFKLQGSLDNITWFDMDTLTGNTANQINRTVTPQIVRYLRVYITKGLTINNQVASIVDFQAFEPANVPLLSNLVPSTGTLVPAFSSRTLNYTINVASTVTSIAFTPTAASGMQIKVNNIVVNSGSQSAQCSLNNGTNTFTITVTSGTLTTTYKVNVIKAAPATYLNNLTVIDDTTSTITLTPSFTGTTLNYTATTDPETAFVKVMPVITNTSSVIKVNNTVVASGQYSGPLTMNSGNNTITIVVDSVTTYTIIVSK